MGAWAKGVVSSPFIRFGYQGSLRTLQWRGERRRGEMGQWV